MFYIRQTNLLILFLLLLPLNSLCRESIIDLGAINHDFVLEAKRIQIPGYPYTFNPSIVRWNDSFLMTFRIHDGEKQSIKPIGLIWLDKNFNIISKPYILEIRNQKKNTFFVHESSKIAEQDPRLININNRLYMVYNNFQVGRMLIAEIHFDNNSIFLDNPECLLYFENANPNRIEKNWVPFEYDNQLLLSYSISPHKIFLPIEGTETCKTYAYSHNNILWNWGEIRGGTPALLVDGRYLAFFHSSKCMRSNYSNGENIQHYFMGAYTFEPHQPFNITHISPNPIICDDFYTGEDYAGKTWKPLRVVFPMGFVFDDDYIWISYGKQDFECWIVKLDKNKLLNSLVPVKLVRAKLSRSKSRKRSRYTR
ncbi:MAG: hypothetical protein V1646_05015 [bacterium]